MATCPMIYLQQNTMTTRVAGRWESNLMDKKLKVKQEEAMMIHSHGPFPSDLLLPAKPQPPKFPEPSEIAPPVGEQVSYS